MLFKRSFPVLALLAALFAQDARSVLGVTGQGWPSCPARQGLIPVFHGARGPRWLENASLIVL